MRNRLYRVSTIVTWFICKGDEYNICAILPLFLNTQQFPTLLDGQPDGSLTISVLRMQKSPVCFISVCAQHLVVNYRRSPLRSGE